MPVEITDDIDALTVNFDQDKLVVKGYEDEEERLRAELEVAVSVENAAEPLRDLADEIEETGSGYFFLEGE